MCQELETLKKLKIPSFTGPQSDEYKYKNDISKDFKVMND